DAARAMSRVVLSGYYGFDNLGDEAVLAATVAAIRQKRPDAGIAVLSADPPGTSRALGVYAVAPSPFGPVVGVLRGRELFPSGGAKPVPGCHELAQPVVLPRRARDRPAPGQAHGCVRARRRPAARPCREAGGTATVERRRSHHRSGSGFARHPRCVGGGPIARG